MKKTLRNFFLQGMLLFVLFLTTSVSWGQVTILSENMGTGTGTALITANAFQNTNVTFSGTADVRTTLPSSGYTGASGGKNVFFTASGRDFMISNINTSGYSNITLSFGQLKTATAANNELVVEYSIDGTNFTLLPYTRPSGAANAYVLVTPTGTLPAASNLRLRFTSESSNQWRLDDVKLTGTAAPVGATVTTTQIVTTVNTTTSAVSGGTITNTGGNTVTAKGVVWSTATAPTVDLTTKTNEGAGNAAFTSTLTGLSANTKYYYRAYVTFGSTNYGTEYSFTTRPLTPGAPVVNNAGINKLEVAINANGNNSTVRYSIRVNGNGVVNQFVNANGTISNANNPEVFQTAAQWGTKQITGLTGNTTYSIDVRAENTANEFSAYGPVATGTTLPATAPALTIGTASVTFGNVCTNAFAVGNFTFTGSNISGTAIINVAALPGYSYSLSQDGTYTSTLSIQDFTGSSVTVYVRFTPSSAQRYNGNIELAGQGDNASAQLVVPVTGAGINTAGVVTTVAPVSSEIITSATLQGTATTGGCTAFSAYGFEYSTTPGFASGTGTTIAATNLTGVDFSATVNGLLPSTTYYYKAFGTDGAGTHYGTQQSFTTESLQAPLTIAATTITQTSFTANWTAVEGAENYKLDVSASASFGTGTLATDLFFSEYVEGSGTNRYVEIYNGTGTEVDLSDYTVRLFANGALNSTSQTFLSGTLANGATLVLSQSDATLYTGDATIASVTNYNGDDAIALYKVSNNTYVDIFGRIGEDPGNAWTAAGISTLDRTLVRKSNVVNGVTVNPETGFPTLAAEWDSYPTDNVSFLGAHTYDFAPLYITGYDGATIEGVSETIVGLTQFTTYYYRVRANSTTSTSDVSNVTSVTTKASTVTWTIPEGQEFAVWSPLTYPDTSPVILDSTVDAVINAPYNTGIHGNFSAKNIILNAGKTFTVATGNTLIVGGTITNNANPQDFVVENNAALLQNNFDSNTSAITVIKNSNPLYRLDYTMWSSPVDGQTLKDFSRRTAAGRFYEYAYSNSDNEEHYRPVPSSTTFGAAKGYLIRMPDSNSTPGYNDGTATYTFPGTFKGAPHNGQVTIPASQQGNRYTAIGNPYPSPVSVTDFFAANSGVINPSSGLYFWRKKNNAEASSYATLTLAAYTSNGGGSGYTPNPGEGTPDGQADFFSGAENTWLISQGQGFIVQTAETPAGTDITFNNSMRRPAPESGQQSFFRTGASNTSRIWLNMTDSENNYSQAAIAYMSNATLGIDYGYDGAQLTDAGTLSLYSIAENAKLAVQARPDFTTTDRVLLGYKANNSGRNSLSLNRADGIFVQGQEVYLRDNVLNILHNLNDGNYTFTTEAGTFNDRFEVVYTTPTLNIDDAVLNNNTVIVYKNGRDISITSSKAEITDVAIYDVQGRKLYSEHISNSTEAVIAGLEATHEVLIVEVKTSKGKVSKKILF